jgi:hypothetical protein
MNPIFAKHMQAVRTALGAGDPAVAAMGAIGEILGLMETDINDLKEKIDTIEASAATLRIARIRNFFLILGLGIVIGGAGAGYWMNGHGYMGVFWQHGVKVRTSENKDLLQFQISGDNAASNDWVLDANGKVIGVTMIYNKEKKK